MSLRDWSGSRLILTWIWSSLVLGLTEPIADAVGHPLTSGTSNGLRFVLFVILVVITWKWYRIRTRLPEHPREPHS